MAQISKGQRNSNGFSSIIYAAISRSNNFTIGDYCVSTISPEDEELINKHCRQLIGQMQRSGKRREDFFFESRTFTLQAEDGLVFVCVSEGSPSKSAETTNSKFLALVKRQYSEKTVKYPPWTSSRQALISQLLRRLTLEEEEEESEDSNSFASKIGAERGTQKIEKVERELEDVTEIMKGNISKVIERGEQISCLVDKTQDLENDALQFRSTAKRYRRSIWWTKARNYIVAISVFTILSVVTLGWLFGVSLEAD